MRVMNTTNFLDGSDLLTCVQRLGLGVGLSLFLLTPKDNPDRPRRKRRLSRRVLRSL